MKWTKSVTTHVALFYDSNERVTIHIRYLSRVVFFLSMSIFYGLLLRRDWLPLFLRFCRYLEKTNNPVCVLDRHLRWRTPGYFYGGTLDRRALSCVGLPRSKDHRALAAREHVMLNFKAPSERVPGAFHRHTVA